MDFSSEELSLGEEEVNVKKKFVKGSNKRKNSLLDEEEVIIVKKFKKNKVCIFGFVVVLIGWFVLIVLIIKKINI